MREGNAFDNETQCREEGNEDQQFSKRRRLVRGNEAKPLRMSQVAGSDKDRLQKKQRLVIGKDKTNTSMPSGSEPLKTSHVDPFIPKPSNISKCNYYVESQPIFYPVFM